MRNLFCTALMIAGASTLAAAQTQPPASDTASKSFVAGTPLKQQPNVKTYGGFRFAESVSYDAERDLYVAVNAGMAQDVVPNDGYISLINPDGTAHTLKWIGVNRNGLTLNHPLGSDIANGMLYVVDIDTVRWFDMKTGEPRGATPVAGATRFNDLEVAADGTIYATQTGTTEPESWRVYKITPKGEASIIVSGAPLSNPNGIALDAKGNVVVVNIGSNAVLTFSPDGKLLSTEESTDPGNDGLVVLPDGTKYVSSVRLGTVARIRPGQKAERIADGIPNAASMTYDSKRNRLVIPMNDWNAITIVELGPAPGTLPAEAAAKLSASLKSAAPHKQHVWRDTPPFAGQLLNAYIEIPRGGRQKFELDMAKNAPAIDRVIPEKIGGYPVNYGIVPQTVSYDGDPFDVLVLGPPLKTGEVVKGVIVGLMQMTDEKGIDSKVVISRVGKDGKPVHQLTDADRARIADYFNRYKRDDDDPKTFATVPGWGTAADGLAFVRQTHEFFVQALK